MRLLAARLTNFAHTSFSYDFFYKNGVPKWRGTGYYYSRFRPGLGVSAAPCSLYVQGAHDCCP